MENDSCCKSFQGKELGLGQFNNNLETTYEFHSNLTDNSVVDKHSCYHSEQLEIALDDQYKICQ